MVILQFSTTTVFTVIIIIKVVSEGTWLTAHKKKSQENNTFDLIRTENTNKNFYNRHKAWKSLTMSTYLNSICIRFYDSPEGIVDFGGIWNQDFKGRKCRWALNKRVVF